MTSATGTWKKPATNARGFTLVEVIITVAIMALATAVMVPAVRNMGRGELRRIGSQLAANLRHTFDDAALSGRTERVVITLGEAEEARVVVIEATADQLNFEGHDGALERAVEPNALDEDTEAENLALGAQAVPQGADADAAGALAGGMGGAMGGGIGQSLMGAAMGINQLALRAARPTFTREGVMPLPPGIRIVDVLAEGMTQPVQDGAVHITFFPHGYTQGALIHLKDADENMLTVHLESLTGRAWVEEGYIHALELQRENAT